MRSAFSNYKRSVRQGLIKNHYWSTKDATLAVTSLNDYIIAMYESACPIKETARCINTMRKEVINAK